MGKTYLEFGSLLKGVKKNMRLFSIINFLVCMMFICFLGILEIFMCFKIKKSFQN